MLNTLNLQVLHLFNKNNSYKNVKSILKNFEKCSGATLSTKALPQPPKNYNTNDKNQDVAYASNSDSQIEIPEKIDASKSLNQSNLYHKLSNFDIVTNHHLKYKLEDYNHDFAEEVVKSDIKEIKTQFSNRNSITYDEGDNVRNINISDLMWKELPSSKDPIVKALLNLSKIRLTGLVAMTAVAGYAMAPGVFEVSTLLSCSLGVVLTSSAANSINQFFEVPYDSQMNRTMNRPIVKGTILPHHAIMFAGASGTAGVALLLAGTNALTAGLGLTNILLYSLVYTPLKRTTMANTWVGSLVGAIPPAMGWTAATGSFGVGGLLVGGLLYCWQFPHFCALSWNLQADYSRAGYRMMAVVDPALCKRVSLRYSILLLSSSFLFPLYDLTTWTFAVDSLPPNLYLVYLAWRFYKEGDSSSSRKLFRFTLIHLPILLLLMIISKKHYGGKKETGSNVERSVAR